MVGRVGPNSLEFLETHRFRNIPVTVLGTLHWDILSIYREILDGLRTAAKLAPGLASVAIDSWAVDYGLLDDRGALLSNPVHYRDGRTRGVVDKVLAGIDAQWLYQTTRTAAAAVKHDLPVEGRSRGGRS